MFVWREPGMAGGAVDLPIRPIACLSNFYGPATLSAWVARPVRKHHWFDTNLMQQDLQDWWKDAPAALLAAPHAHNFRKCKYKYRYKYDTNSDSSADLWKVAPAAGTPSAACTQPPQRGQPSSGPRSPANRGQVGKPRTPAYTPTWSVSNAEGLLQKCWRSATNQALGQLGLPAYRSPQLSKLKSLFLESRPSHICARNSPDNLSFTTFDQESNHISRFNFKSKKFAF